MYPRVGGAMESSRYPSTPSIVAMYWMGVEYAAEVSLLRDFADFRDK